MFQDRAEQQCSRIEQSSSVPGQSRAAVFQGRAEQNGSVPDLSLTLSDPVIPLSRNTVYTVNIPNMYTTLQPILVSQQGRVIFHEQYCMRTHTHTHACTDTHLHTRALPKTHTSTKTNTPNSHRFATLLSKKQTSSISWS